MGTSTAGSESHSDKLAKLQARKKELEALLAAKNEDLYKLCVQEVKLTGVMPPEAPVETAPSESVVDGASEKFERRNPDVAIRKDPGEAAQPRRSRQSHRQPADKGKDISTASRKQICHRLSTPSISGLSIKSNPTRRTDHATASCSTLSHDTRDTFSLHSSQTYPTLQISSDKPSAIRDAREPNYSRHHTLTTEHVNKLYYTTKQPETQSFSRVHETHFSSSHPDITTQYTHTLLTTQASVPGNMPLLYQYASQLKARSPHLSSVQQRPRRNTLQRTQTYHLTAHSDHALSHDTFNTHGNRHHSDQSSQDTFSVHGGRHHSDQSPQETFNTQGSKHHGDLGSLKETFITHGNRHSDHASPQETFNNRHHSEQTSPQEVFTARHHGEQTSPQEPYNSRHHGDHSSPSHPPVPYQLPSSPLSPHSSQLFGLNSGSNPSIYSSQYVDAQDQKVKEKEWYESSLDSPSSSGAGMNLSKESVHYHSPKKTIQRSPSVSQQHVTHIDSAPISSLQQAVPLSPLSHPPPNVPLESPKNCTVVESGKWIPYREVSKPFEMADFYKYSTKFRQSNNNTSQKPRTAAGMTNNTGTYPNSPEDVRYHNITQEQWRHAHPL